MTLVLLPVMVEFFIQHRFLGYLSGATRHFPLKVDSRAVASIQGSAIRLKTPVGFGSGVIIDRTSNSYTALTAWHVVSSTTAEEELIIQLNDKTEIKVPFSGIKQLLPYDLAILKFQSKKEIITQNFIVK